VPVFAGVEFLVEDEARFVCFGLQGRVEGVNFVVEVPVDDSDEGGVPGEVSSQHHIVVYFAGFPLDIDLENALQLQVPPLETVFS